MSYEPLHHKYRPQRFIELVGQEAIAQTLTHALESDRIAPAYLFTGPRGTGKTSSARILSKSLNCLQSDRPTPSPCGKCEVCLQIARGSAMDVIEIDAASNTGVDNIREIIERAQFAPVQCRYKVYVIDECHMLSTPAFNALLKTLEEPPNRVIFVLATTDPQRVLNTIISRCQRFDFRRIPLKPMVTHLTDIAAKEEINIASDALTLVAQIANGGLRDAESLLDQLSLIPDEVTVEKVWDLVGAVPERDLLALIKAIHSDDPEAVIGQCRHLMDRGREPLIVLQNLATFYLNLLIAKTSPQRNDLVAVTTPTWQELCEEAKQWDIAVILQGQQKLKESEVQIKNTTQPRLWLEVTLLGLLPSAIAAFLPTNTTPQSLPKTKPDRANIPPRQSEQIPTRSPVSPPPPSVEKSPFSEVKQFSQTQAISPPSRALSDEEKSQKINEDTWHEVIKTIEKMDARVFAEQKCYLISLDYEKSIAYLGLSSPNLVSIAKSKKLPIEVAFKEVCWVEIKVEFQVEKKNKSPRIESNSGAIAKKNNTTPSNSASFSTHSTHAIAKPTSEVKANSLSQNSIAREKATSPQKPAFTSSHTKIKESPVSQIREKIAAKKTSDRAPASPNHSPPQPSSPEPQIIEPDREEENETTLAAQEFASIFEGEVLELELEYLSDRATGENHLESPAIQTSSQSQQPQSLPPEENPNDMPF